MQHLSVIAGVSVLGHKVFFSDTVFCFPPPSFLFISLNIAYHAGKIHAGGIAWSITELKITCLKKEKKKKKTRNVVLKIMIVKKQLSSLMDNQVNFKCSLTVVSSTMICLNMSFLIQIHFILFNFFHQG